MKLWHGALVGSSAVVFAAILAAVQFGGGTDHTTFAHLITATPSGANAVHFEIDMVKDGDHWCDPVDTEFYHNVGVSHQVAVCLTSSAKPPASFNFDLVYDDSINQCAPDTDCTVGTCTDDNPDANADDSLATFTTWTVPDLGDGYDCGKGGSQPKCDIDTDTGVDQGRAYISCFTTDVPTLPIGSGVSSPLAVVTFNATAEGVDTLHLENVAAYDEAGAEIASCYEGDEPYPCFDGTDTKSGEPPPATNTPTVTPTPTPTNTPCPGGECPTSTPTPKAWTKTPTPPATGTPTPAEPSGGEQPAPPPPPPTGGQLPQVVPPGTGSGPADGVPWLNTLIWLVAGVGAVSVALGGLHVRYARHR